MSGILGGEDPLIAEMSISVLATCEIREVRISIGSVLVEAEILCVSASFSKAAAAACRRSASSWSNSGKSISVGKGSGVGVRGLRGRCEVGEGEGM